MSKKIFKNDKISDTDIYGSEHYNLTERAKVLKFYYNIFWTMGYLNKSISSLNSKKKFAMKYPLNIFLKNKIW